MFREAWFCLIVTIVSAWNGFAAEPQAVNPDRRISIDAEASTLARVLQLWDQATGMRSSVPPDLASQPISVRFSELSVNDAVRRIFEKQPFDYVFVRGQGIIVTSASNPAAAGAPAPVREDVKEVTEEPPVQEVRRPSPVVEPEKPRMMPSPFGSIVDSGNSLVHRPPVPGERTAIPFFAPRTTLPTPPAGAPNGPIENDLFAPISIYPTRGWSR